MYKQNLALNNQQELICHKTQPTYLSTYVSRSESHISCLIRMSHKVIGGWRLVEVEPSHLLDVVDEQRFGKIVFDLRKEKFVIELFHVEKIASADIYRHLMNVTKTKEWIWAQSGGG